MVIDRVRKWLRRQRHERQCRRWELSGRVGSPPHLVKQKVVRQIADAHGSRVLVETGTCMGDMVEAMRGRFDHVYTIELSDSLYERASERFAACPNVTLVHGDSGVELARVADRLPAGDTLFWLDGHWSGGPTARGETDTPVADELSVTLERVVQGDVVLIDDARLFGSDPDYPTIESLRDRVSAEAPGATLAIDRDVIVIQQPRAAA
ncbi:MAG: hypothetical protein AAF805_11540 [Planctomycetota bacterium]